MTNVDKLSASVGMAALLMLAGCGSMNSPMSASGPAPTYYPPSATSSGAYERYGVVQSVEFVRQGNSSIGAGTIVGAVVGGIVGNQVGRGSGNTAATVIGAAGGAYAGHEIEKRNQPQIDAYKLTIQMRDGSNLALMQTANVDIRVGDRVIVEGGVARRY